MATDKKSFILYCDTIHTVKKMTKVKAGELFLIILKYVNDENPEITDPLLDLVFEPIKQQLKRDLRKYEHYIEKQVINGKKGGRPRKDKKPKESQKTQAFFSKPKKAGSVSVSDSVSVRESKEKKTPAILNFETNLNRQPVIPTKEEVLECFVRNGGTKEMADSFYNSNESTGWFYKGSPITNFSTRVYSFITNWNKNENGKEKIVNSDLAMEGQKIRDAKTLKTLNEINGPKHNQQQN